MTYQDLKSILTENKDKIVLAGCFVLVFVVGFGTGRYVGGDTAKQLQSNYTTKPAKKTTPIPTDTVQQSKQQVLGTATSSVPSAACVVKGNISSSGKKIYHVAGGAFYKTVKPEQCFNTPEEAEAAGFVKSSR